MQKTGRPFEISSPSNLRCSFCGRDQREVAVGPGIYICEECAGRAAGTFGEGANHS